jgi:predicted metal-binding membrane protein
MATRDFAPDRAVLAIAALLFAGSAAVTITWCASMENMPGMEMPGGWRMSMTWMRMPGQGFAQATAGFLGMWAVMMLAMMLPAVTPALDEYRRAAGARAGSLTTRVAAAYFGVWSLFGLAVYPLGLAIAELEMRVAPLARIVPALAGVALLITGILQASAWKARQLECCRAPRRRGAAAPVAAWRYGFTLGVRCCACCAPLTAALLVTGVMNLGAMAAATVAISLERLAPRGRMIARLSGALLAGTGLCTLVRAVT